MPTRTISNDLKDRIPALFYDGYNVKEICKLLGIKKSLAYKTLTYHRCFNVAHNPHARSAGRHRKLSRGDTDFIRAALTLRNTLYLDEIQTLLLEKRHVQVSFATLVRTLRRLHFTHKRVSKRAIERNQLRRAAFMNRIGVEVPDPNMLMFTDEAAKDERTQTRNMGWSLRGVRCEQRACFVRGRRYSILPLLTLDGIVTFDIIEGSVTSTRFTQFLRELVIPLTNPYPGPRSVLVLDNCRIHHSEEVRALVEDEAQCKLIFLPPYSPDYNPIEMAFSSIKAFLRREWQEKTLCTISAACFNITPDMAESYFSASGYL